MTESPNARAAQSARETQAMLLIIFGLVMGGVAGLTIGLMSARSCNGIEDAPWGCFEFVLARYQTIIAAAIAGLIAAHAARPVFRQLREMRRQSAAMARSAANELITQLLAEKHEAGSPLLSAMHEFDYYAQQNWARNHDPVVMISDVTEARVALRKHANRGLGSKELQEAREALIRSSILLISTYRRWVNTPEEVAIEDLDFRRDVFANRQMTYHEAFEETLGQAQAQERTFLVDLLEPR